MKKYKYDRAKIAIELTHNPNGWRWVIDNLMFVTKEPESGFKKGKSNEEIMKAMKKGSKENLFKPESNKEKCSECNETKRKPFGCIWVDDLKNPHCIKCGRKIVTNPDPEPESKPFPIEKLEHIPDPYGKGWCIANKSESWYAPDGDYANQIDIIRRTMNEIINYLANQK